MLCQFPVGGGTRKVKGRGGDKWNTKPIIKRNPMHAYSEVNQAEFHSKGVRVILVELFQVI